LAAREVRAPDEDTRPSLPCKRCITAVLRFDCRYDPCVTGSSRQALESAPHFQTKIFATPMRKCVAAMTSKVLAASSLFDEIEVPRDTIRLTVWNVDVFVARKSHVAEREESGRCWHTSVALVVQAVTR